MDSELSRTLFHKMANSSGHFLRGEFSRTLLVNSSKVHVTSPVLGSDDLTLDQSAMSIEILLEPLLVM